MALGVVLVTLAVIFLSFLAAVFGVKLGPEFISSFAEFLKAVK